MSADTPSNGRLPGIDALRILGAVLVVGLHVGLFPEWPVALMEISRACGRWVVPFFFLVMGFFIGQRPGIVAPALATAGRVVQILLVCTLIYGVLVVAQQGPRQGLLRLVSPETVVRGVWGHLWFLHAALAGLLLAAARPQWLASRRAWPVLIVALLLCSALDTLFAMKRIDWGTMFASRFAAGLCLVWLGVKLAGVPAEVLRGRWLVLLVIGVVLTVVQGALVAWRGGEPAELQLQIGAIVCGVAALAAGLAMPAIPAMERLADWGRRFALGLYLLHPLVIEALRRAGVTRADVLWLIAALATLALLLALERWLPAAKALLDGRAPTSPRAGHDVRTSS
ncbi:hypothetical protein CDN99_03750 [Roseateles aquatilis]|uniref:Acyltransferase 3 domain-containing protein n=1 Tax=Roseateles aquatilis TaxID=431061 RepID=A0A246JLR7_9BURK|nr:acyltransferase family protein [Roseateles aquatilis]OWQ93586.1 hypothetical protein CDN99_03750 [Roseateles aquatilis]